MRRLHPYAALTILAAVSKLHSIGTWKMWTCKMYASLHSVVCRNAVLNC
jgi:hypothetical protein